MQAALDLAGGSHAGPLFIVVKARPLVRPKGKEGAVHRAQQLVCTPPWSEKGAIRLLYREARRLTRESGVLHVVDHIVPKCGETVCGLHVLANLRIIHWLENAQKGANWWPDMWMEQAELF